jgi:hypothetical protein
MLWHWAGRLPVSRKVAGVGYNYRFTLHRLVAADKGCMINIIIC